MPGHGLGVAMPCNPIFPISPPTLQPKSSQGPPLLAVHHQHPGRSIQHLTCTSLHQALAPRGGQRRSSGLEGSQAPRPACAARCCASTACTCCPLLSTVSPCGSVGAGGAILQRCPCGLRVSVGHIHTCIRFGGEEASDRDARALQGLVHQGTTRCAPVCPP